MKKLFIFSAATMLATMTFSLSAMAKDNANVIKVSAYTSDKDISTSINDAIADAASRGNTDVHLAAGKYTVNHPIKLVSGVNLIVDPDAKIVRETNNYIVLADENCKDVTISGGKWDGSSKTEPLMYFEGEQIQVKDSSLDGGGIFLGGKDNKLNNIEEKGSKSVGINIRADKAQLNNCTIRDNGNQGIVIRNRSSVKISGCNIIRNGKNKTSKGHGIGIAYDSVATISKTNISENDQCGISLSNASTVNLIEGNTINSNGRHGIGTDSGDTVNVVKGSKFNHNGFNGISIGRGSKGNISNAEVKNNAISGISVNDSSATICNSKVTRNKQYGILTNKAKVTITKSAMNSNVKYGLCSSTKSNVKVTKSKFVGNKIFGIFGQHSGTKVAVKNKCIIANNAKAGIHITNKAKLSMSNCTIEKNGSIGISLNKGGIAQNIKNNVIKNHKNCGIYRDGASMKNVKKNKISGTPLKFN